MDMAIENINALVNAYFPGVVGVTFTEAVPGKTVCKSTVTPRLHNPGGILHGGVPYTLADTGMAMALMLMLDEGKRFSTLEIKMSYLNAVVEGEIVCTTVVLNKGNRIAFLESEITSGEKVVATASGTFYIA